MSVMLQTGQSNSDEPTHAPPSRWRINPLRLLKRMGNGALDALYPPLCVACNTITNEAASLCPACWRDMPFITRPFCERLGSPFAVDIGGSLLSPAAIADPPVFRFARAVALHKGAAQDMVHKLKYGDRQELAKAMARMMASAGGELTSTAQVIVPVPMHWTRLVHRRFNQAAVLARVLAAQVGLPLESEALMRRKRTPTQVRLTKAERQQNLQGAFAVRPEARHLISGRRVLLIDDVVTTGSTANAAASVLLRAGATEVNILSFTRVVTTA
jgi:ComF family protein